MAHRTYTIKGAIAANDVDLFVKLGELMDEFYATGIVSVTLYDSANYDNPVNASAGILTITASEDNFNFGTVDNNVIDLTDPEYLRPSFRALVTNIRGTWSGVTGATHYVIKVWRHTY